MHFTCLGELCCEKVTEKVSCRFMTLQQETRIKYLEKIKKDLCESVARKYAEHLLSIPKDLQSTLTMQEFINDYHGNVQEFLEAASAPKSKRTKPTKKTKAVAKSRVRASTVSTLDTSDQDIISRESSVSGDYHDRRSCRRITLQGAGSEVEILLPSTASVPNPASQEVESLSKEELLKLQATLKAAQSKTDALLASLGI